VEIALDGRTRRKSVQEDHAPNEKGTLSKVPLDGSAAHSIAPPPLQRGEGCILDEVSCEHHHLFVCHGGLGRRSTAGVPPETATMVRCGPVVCKLLHAALRSMAHVCPVRGSRTLRIGMRSRDGWTRFLPRTSAPSESSVPSHQGRTRSGIQSAGDAPEPTCWRRRTPCKHSSRISYLHVCDDRGELFENARGAAADDAGARKRSNEFADVAVSRRHDHRRSCLKDSYSAGCLRNRSDHCGRACVHPAPC